MHILGQLFINDRNLPILIPTDSLKAGNDFPNIADVVVFNRTDPNDNCSEDRT
jgi:hypothetical protein